MASDDDDYMLQLALAMSMYDQGSQAGEAPGGHAAEIQQQLQSVLSSVMAQQQLPSSANPAPPTNLSTTQLATNLAASLAANLAANPATTSAANPAANPAASSAIAQAGSASASVSAGLAAAAANSGTTTGGPGMGGGADLMQLQAALAMALQGAQAGGVSMTGSQPGMGTISEEEDDNEDPMDIDPHSLLSMLPPPAASRSLQQPTSTSARPGPPPSWLTQLEQWLPAKSKGPPHSELSLSSEVVGKALAELGKWMQTSVATAPGNNSTLIMLAAKTPGQSCITSKEMDQLVNRRLQQLRSSGTPQAQLLCSWYTAAQQAPASDPVLQPLSQLLQWATASKALTLLLEDEEGDLFYESGLYTTQFMNAVSSGLISAEFLGSMLATSEANRLSSKVWTNVLKLGFERANQLKFTEPADLNALLFPLDILLRAVPLQQALASRLAFEAQCLSAKWTSRSIATSSLLGPLLRPSPMVDPAKVLTRGVESPAKEVFLTLRGYPNVPGDIEMAKNSIRNSLDKVQDAAHQLCKRVATLKTSPPNMGREALVSWLSGVARVNEFRLSAGDRGMLRPDMLMRDMQDGLLVNLTAVCLRFCRPFMQGYLSGEAKFADLFTKHLDPSYYPSNLCRLPSYPNITTLAGAKPAVTAPGSMQIFHPSPSDKGYPSFIADIFFTTQRMMHVVMLPAIHMFEQLVQALSRKLQEDDERGKHRSAGQSQLMLLYDCNLSQLLAPALAGDAAQFAVLQLVWLHYLVSQNSADAFKLIPQYVVKDACGLLIFIIRSRGAEHLAHTPIGLLMQSLVSLLERPDLLRSPLVHSKMVELVLVMLSPQIDVQRRTVGGSLGRTHMLPAESALVAAVLGSTAAQEQLIPALLGAYVSADYVEGLDVDKDDYDKFSMRHFVDLILEELYKDEPCVRCMTQLAEAGMKEENGSNVFASYMGCVLNDLIYLFKDSLDRLADIHSIEASKADKAAWAALPIMDRQDKERFYSGQQHTATGFLRLAITTLRVLDMLASNPTISQTFLRGSLSSQTIYAINHFLELLVGPRCQQLQVHNPSQYHFDREQLLVSITALCLRLAEHPTFPEILAKDADYDPEIMTQTRDLLNGLHKYEHVDRLEKLMHAVGELRERQAQTEGATGLGAGTNSQEGQTGTEGSAKLEFEVAEPENVEDVYVQELTPLTVSTFDSSLPGSYNRHFAEMAAEAAGNTAGKMKRLSREFRDLQSRTRLPIHAASSIFVRHDEDRWDKVRALISGPEDTPYAHGCFIFDMFFPARYPEIPPLMLLETTGEGRARFNPNLYADGKVCLSLLGTWHGGSESEKWNPNSSSMFQILLSIQGMIFVEDPYFNEPNVELMRGKSEGISASAAYNSQIQLNTIRYAMLDVLRRPRPGFEDVIIAHFKLLRHRIIKQCKEWLQQAAAVDAGLHRRMETSVTELHQMLSGL